MRKRALILPYPGPSPAVPELRKIMSQFEIMRKKINKIVFALVICLLFSKVCSAGSKLYYLKNPKPGIVKEIQTNAENSLYIVERLGIKTWYGFLVVPGFNEYIPINEVIKWNEIAGKRELKGWIFVDTVNKNVHISVVVKDNKTNTFKPFEGNGVFELR